MTRNRTTRILVICDPDYDVRHLQNAVQKSIRVMQLKRVSFPSDIHELSIDNADIAFLDLGALRRRGIDPSELGDTLYSHIPIIFLGEEHDGQLALAGIRAGAQDWLLNTHLYDIAITPIIENVQRAFLNQRDLVVNHARYQSVVEDQSELIYRCTSHYTVTFVNQAYANQLGVATSRLEGTCLSKIKNPRDFDAYKRKIQSLSPEFSTAQHEECNQTNGDTYWYQWTDKAFFDSNGVLLEIQSVGADITARRCAEQEATDGRKRFQSLYENAPVMMQELNARGRILSVNKRWLEVMDQHPKHVLGHHAFRFLDKQSNGSVRGAVEELRRNGQVRNILCRYKRATRRPIDIIASATSNLWDENQNIRILIVSTELNYSSPFTRRPPVVGASANKGQQAAR
ncbi:PAS domain S-box protein [Granulosicoccus sp.]|nr:PAS domain S-box protein [Granulosicoccus sp.]MDB4222494.1 PAS domain S-box protein [Granulosicoccus sp.]